MATVLDLITRAYRKIGVVASDDTLSADQAANGLDAFNAMMFGFPLVGINLEHTEQGLGDTVAVDAKYHEGLVYTLARRLGEDSLVAWPDEDRWVRAMQMATFIGVASVTDAALMNTPSQVYPNGFGT